MLEARAEAAEASVRAAMGCKLDEGRLILDQLRWEDEAAVTKACLEAMSGTLSKFDNTLTAGFPTLSEKVGILLSRNTTSPPPYILSDNDTENIPQHTQVRSDPAMSLIPVSFQADPLSPAINAAAPTSMNNPSTSIVSNRQVLSAQYNMMPAPGLSYTTHQASTNALHTTFVS